MFLLRAFYEAAADMSPGMVGTVDFESLFAHLGNKRTIAEKNSFRPFLGIQQFAESAGLESVYSLPGTGTVVDGLTRVQGDMMPLLPPVST